MMTKLTPYISPDTPPSRPGVYLCNDLSTERLVLWTGILWEVPEGFAVVEWRGLECDHVWVDDEHGKHCTECGSTQQTVVKRKPGRPRKVATPEAAPAPAPAVSVLDDDAFN